MRAFYIFISVSILTALCYCAIEGGRETSPLICTFTFSDGTMAIAKNCSRSNTLYYCDNGVMYSNFKWRQLCYFIVYMNIL